MLYPFFAMFGVGLVGSMYGLTKMARYANDALMQISSHIVGGSKTEIDELSGVLESILGLPAFIQPISYNQSLACYNEGLREPSTITDYNDKIILCSKELEVTLLCISLILLIVCECPS